VEVAYRLVPRLESLPGKPGPAKVMTLFIIPAIGYLLTLAFGLWVSHIGKPYNGLLFNVHKLLALGTVILTVIRLVKALKTVDASALIIVSLIVAAVCVIALFLTGAFMSIGNLDYTLVLTIHRIALALVGVSTALVVYLLVKM
jgi:hypothetical protein